MREDLVSVIIPTYNDERFISQTIESVISQTYNNWEIVLIDDCSVDSTQSIVKKYLKKDSRINYIRLKKNSGVAIARNKGIEMANGRYLCFLDADDKWQNNKLEKQIKFMKSNNYLFTFTSYQFADKNCNPTGKKVIVPSKINYRQAIKNTTIWTSTVMFDIKVLGKDMIYMPIVESEDTACWWKVLKTGVIAYGIKDILSFYRRTGGTLSSNKLKAIKRIWNLYRNVEKFNLIYSIFNFMIYAFNAVRRRI